MHNSSRETKNSSGRHHVICTIASLAIVAIVGTLTLGWQQVPPLTTNGDKNSNRRKLQFFDLGQPVELFNTATNVAYTSPFSQFLQNTFSPTLPAFTPFYEPRQYSLHPQDAFEMNVLCTDINRMGCNAFNTIRFTNAENPAPNEFRFHDSGPPQMQGVFWTQQESAGLEALIQPDEDNFANSDLVTFARTRHGGGISTGFLQTDSNGYEYVQRPLGDHSWSTSANSLETHLTSVDVLYIYDLTRGTLQNPLAFEIVTNFKVFFECLRFSFGRLGGSK